MQLPVDEEHDEQVVRVPEALKVGATALLHGVPDHDTERGGHDPASDAGSGREVRSEEGDDDEVETQEGLSEEESDEEEVEGEEESEEGSGDYYESKDPAYLEALAAALAASKRSGLWDFGQQGLSSSGAGPSVVAAEGTSVSARAPVSPTTPARVFRSGTLRLSVPSAEGKG